MLKIRPARPDDAEAIININVMTWKTAYKGLLPDDVLANRNVKEESIIKLRTTIENKEKIVLSAVKEGRVIGYCMGGMARDKSFPYAYELFAIYVQPEEQKSGAGALLIKAFHKEINNNSFYCFALKGNEPAARFYRKHGGVERPEYARQLAFPQFSADEIMFSFDN